MKTFDVSVNVLNDKLSDKLLWKDRGGRPIRAPEGERLPTNNLMLPPKQLPPSAVSAPEGLPASNSGSISGVSCLSRTPPVPLEISLLTLPCTFLFAFVLLFQSSDIGSAEKISILVGCALLLATPAVLLVWHQRTSSNKHVYVHMLFFHEAALLVVLRPETIWTISVVFVVVFAQLCVQLPTRRVVCGVIVLLNVATATLIVTSQQISSASASASPATQLAVVLCSACVVLTSVATYACIAVAMV